MKAHMSDNELQKEAAAALARIQHFIDAASVRAEANMAELIAGEEAGKGATVSPKKAGKGKGKVKGGEAAAAGPSAPPSNLLPPPPSFPPPVAVDGVPALTKAQIKRHKAKAAADARKADARKASVASMAVEKVEEDEEDTSDASSHDSAPRRPLYDFSKDSEFRRSLKLPPRNVEAEIDEIIAQHEALYLQKSEARPGAAAAALTAPRLAPAASDAADALAPPRDGLETGGEGAALPAPTPLSPNPNDDRSPPATVDAAPEAAPAGRAAAACGDQPTDSHQRDDLAAAHRDLAAARHDLAASRDEVAALKAENERLRGAMSLLGR